MATGTHLSGRRTAFDWWTVARDRSDTSCTRFFDRFKHQISRTSPDILHSPTSLCRPCFGLSAIGRRIAFIIYTQIFWLLAEIHLHLAGLLSTGSVLQWYNSAMTTEENLKGLAVIGCNGPSPGLCPFERPLQSLLTEHRTLHMVQDQRSFATRCVTVLCHRLSVIDRESSRAIGAQLRRRLSVPPTAD
jgi:hypothetical protein